ncbi:branched-chain amino acid ABC transporter permease [Vibrio sp. S9_S30]|uniref:AzlC family ABC transporter permease n=1 Tax=Vibrio sp. S9_S30 TaxID=2720226 RepID=UPI001680EE0C|nr:AzlC family ABC transporter permease [Vibrio sp. S9_S30]MBD1557133.1 branched-chain amino acid ABC transporter permease [Vibrio sp. S9_S30]
MQSSNFINVFKLSLPVATAYIPLGLALGVFMVSSGIEWYWAPISALVIFAGSIEFLVVTFILSSQPLIAVAWTALIVNFRHIFYGLSFPLKSMTSRIQKAYGIFALTDETYAIVCASRGAPLSGADISLLQMISHAWWVGASLLGAVIGALLPPEVTGFEFALTAMFIALAADAISNDSDTSLLIYAVISCVVGALMEFYILKSSFLGSGLICYLLLISKDYKQAQQEEPVHE